MRQYIFKIASIFLVPFLISCEQSISIKETSLTGINSLSYTDVIYKSKRDTVLVSSFDGRISEIINYGDTLKKRLIINLNDEIYSLAYNHAENLIYASTLNKGIVIVDERKLQIEKILPVKNKWTTEVSYSQTDKVLFASGYTDVPHLWNAKDNYKLLSVPEDFSNMQPKAISDNGDIYFDGNGVVGIWNIRKNSIGNTTKLIGRISDLDSHGRLLPISDKKFILKNIKTDSVLFENKHPDWPIYVSSKDTTVRVPVNLPLTDAKLSENYIYTSSIDKSIRKWNKFNGELTEDLLGHKATISALSLSKDEIQLVSVDLKGGIRFWELKNN